MKDIVELLQQESRLILPISLQPNGSTPVRTVKVAFGPAVMDMFFLGAVLCCALGALGE